ncbi:hypothetical protein BGP75_01320 [Motiliproteus sp. MSK22-1]|nr:hypothetical protein BGP75_01320 [Motiliproteus sp. MSK22-1]
MRYLLVSVIALIFLGFLLGNFLLVRTNDQLSLLEVNHRTLENRYEDVLENYENVLGSRELYKTELDQLSDSMRTVESERSRLEREFHSLASRYEEVLGSSQLYQNELDLLNDNIDQIESERRQLQKESALVVSERTLWADSLRVLERKMGLPVSEEMTLDRSMELQQIANERLFMLRGIPNGMPMKEGRMTDRFGMRTHPVSKKQKMHYGVDWSTNIGTPVFATADGVVEFSGYHKKSGYGKLLIISHNFGFKTYYGHLDKQVVKGGNVVRKGQLIGYSGNTGRSTGPHLHYEIRYIFKHLDPVPYLNWDIENYENLFTQSKGIAWDSLRKMHPLNQLEAPLL